MHKNSILPPEFLQDIMNHSLFTRSALAIGCIISGAMLSGCTESSPTTPVAKEHTPFSQAEAEAFPGVLVEEFSDIECPACRKFAPEFEAVQKEFPQVTFKFYHMPIESIHPLAFPSAIAAECAGMIGGEDKRNEYIHAAFAAEKYSSDIMLQAGSDIGLESNAFRTCIETQQTKDIVKKHMEVAKERGVRATPTLFINGKKIEGGMPREDLKKLITAELAK